MHAAALCTFKMIQEAPHRDEVELRMGDVDNRRFCRVDELRDGSNKFADGFQHLERVGIVSSAAERAVCVPSQAHA